MRNAVSTRSVVSARLWTGTDYRLILCEGRDLGLASNSGVQNLTNSLLILLVIRRYKLSTTTDRSSYLEVKSQILVLFMVLWTSISSKLPKYNNMKCQ